MPSSHTSSNHSVKATDPTSLPSHTVYHSPLYYQLAIGLLKPLYRLQVWRRSHKRDSYQQEVAQRFGKHYPTPPSVDASYVKNAKADKADKGIIWCHAVSLGETNTVAPLLDKLLANGYKIWLTNTTQTGFARGASRFADEIAQGQMSHSYVPVDSPAVIEHFLAHVQPVAALFVETELWANILTKLSEHRIPSILVNGRLSASSFKSYQKITAVSASMMKNLTLIIAQDNDSAKRFRQLGANSAKIRVAGSLKWVINTPKNTPDLDAVAKDAAEISNPDSSKLNILEYKIELANKFHMAGRPIWVAASTHSGEEKIALSLHQQLLSDSALANTLLIIVPRHPERFDEVAALIQEAELTMAQRSAEEAIGADTQVYLADSMGELMTWYTLANVALVGGSLVDVGGHNPVEPASVATPVIMGCHTQSCQTVVDKLSEVGALYQPHNDNYKSIESYQPIETHYVAKGSVIKESAINKSADDNVKNKQVKNKKVKTNDTALIYQQLMFWLSDLERAKHAGQAGAQMTMQQQAVLTRQFTMVEKIIEQYSNQALNENVD